MSAQPVNSPKYPPLINFHTHSIFPKTLIFLLFSSSLRFTARPGLLPSSALPAFPTFRTQSFFKKNVDLLHLPPSSRLIGLHRVATRSSPPPSESPRRTPCTAFVAPHPVQFPSPVHDVGRSHPLLISHRLVMAAMTVTGGSRMRSLLHSQLFRTACASTKSRGGDKKSTRLAVVQRLLYQAEERCKAGGGVEPISRINLDHVGISYYANTGGVGGQNFKKVLNTKIDMRTVYPPLSGITSMFTSGFLPRSSKNWVSKTQSAGNQRHKSSLVGTSETTRATTYPKPFCEWLAGIIDGDGSIQVSKQGYTSIEITMQLEDLRLLRYIQHMLGGSIKMRAGAKSYRYRLHSHLGMIKLMNCINGHIRHSARLLQLHRVCQVLEIPVILPIPLDAQSNWFAGFFDADGTITIDMKHGLPQLSIQVTNKLLQDVEAYKVVFGGSLCFDSSRNGYYQWSIQSREDVIMMLVYFKSNTFRSHKSRRFFLIEEYYSLYDLEAFKPDSIHHKAWAAFLVKWNK